MDTDDLAAALAQLLRAAQPAPAPATASLPVMLTVDEAAEAMRVSRSMIYGLMRDGRLPSVRIGRRRLIAAAEVQQYLTGGGDTAATQLRAG